MTGFPILRLPTVQLDPVADFGPESVRRHSDVVQPRRQRGKDGITGAVRRHASCEVGLRIAPVVSVTTPVIWPCVCAVATGAIGKQVTSKTTALLSRLAPNMQPLWGRGLLPAEVRGRERRQVVAVDDQLKTLPSQRMVWMDYFKGIVDTVRMRCS